MSAVTQLNETDQLQQCGLAQAKTFPWHQVFGANRQGLVDFYTKAFDWGTEDFPMGEGGIYKMLTANGEPVAGVIGSDVAECAANCPPHWAVSIGVDNVDARLEKIKELGGTLIVEPMDIPMIGRVALAQDPQGASFWLFTPQGC